MTIYCKIKKGLEIAGFIGFISLAIFVFIVLFYLIASGAGMGMAILTMACAIIFLGGMFLYAWVSEKC